MSSVSRYIQIYPGILLEYIYTDRQNPEEYSTTQAKVEIMRNAYDTSAYFFNAENSIVNTQNFRNTAAAPINQYGSRYISLTTSRGIAYNDLDPNLTPSVDLLQNFSPTVNIQYDKVKIHFESGLDFGTYDGYIFECSVRRRDEKRVKIFSRAFRKTDTSNLDPNPIMIGTTLYTNYLEFLVPSMYFVLQDFLSNSSNTNGLGYRLTEGKGFIKNTPMIFDVYGITKTSRNQGFPEFYLESIQSTTLDLSDNFEYLTASVTESTDGDYFQFEGLYDGQNYDNFIASLNGQPNSDYMVVHNISISEQIGTNFVKTSELAILQTEDYDIPVVYRPVIKNSAIAVSFMIDYAMRLVNRVDNSQIIRYATISSDKVGKYGRRLQKINMGIVPKQVNVYNKVIKDTGTQIVMNDSINVQTQPQQGMVADQPIQTVVITNTVYVDRNTVLARISPVTLNVTKL